MHGKMNLVLAMAAVFAAGLAGSASATITYGADFTYDNGAGYLDGLVGDGIGNIGYALDNPGNGIVVGVKAHPRYTASVLPYVDNHYFATTGQGQFPNGTDYPGLTTWNVAWAVEVSDNYDLTGLEFVWTLDFDPTAGNSNFATMRWTPTPGTPGDGYADGVGSQFWATDQNLGFDYWTDIPEVGWNLGGVFWDNFANIQNIDPFATGEYYMAFGVREVGATDYLAWSDMTVHVDPVPEPASMALLGLGLAGLGVRRMRKRG